LKFSAILPKFFYVGLFVSVPLLCALSASQNPAPKAWGKSINGLQMTIYLDQMDSEQSKLPKFRVELRDAGAHDLIVNLGMMLANGKLQYPDAVDLTLTDAQGVSHPLGLLGPIVIDGRVDPLVVPIPVGAAFSIPVDLDKYVGDELPRQLKSGFYSLQANFAGRVVTDDETNLDVKGISLMPYWTGTVTSNKLRFEIRNQ
jgi:hypothetical protein